MEGLDKKKHVFIGAVRSAVIKSKSPTMKILFNCRPKIKGWTGEQLEEVIFSLVSDEVITINTDGRVPHYSPSVNFDNVPRRRKIKLNDGTSFNENDMIQRISERLK